MKFIWLFVLVLAGLNWLSNFFLRGSLPGIYWFAVTVNQLLAIPAAFLLIGFHVLVWIVIVIFLYGIAKWYGTRRFPWRSLLIPLIIFALVPAFSSTVPADSLTIQPWGKVYHIAYSSIGFDEYFKTLVLYECDRTGLYCWHTYDFGNITGAMGSFKITYNTESDRMSIGVSESEKSIYLRSRSQIICPQNDPDSSGQELCPQA
ncbi:hypothetical protein [Calothrix sp. 336/3]|uniref:hypothetical protein n=1 Tax=Calothrix sp. 336/3 TaxID=1337936 RepID=UPI0004E3EAD3|nr:hypothetical protein [Calothrix sp. 336/3]AKG21122.1 hypothetical protein IJ00_07250 [Calothrix sp. 336/3]